MNYLSCYMYMYHIATDCGTAKHCASSSAGVLRHWLYALWPRMPVNVIALMTLVWIALLFWRSGGSQLADGRCTCANQQSSTVTERLVFRVNRQSIADTDCTTRVLTAILPWFVSSIASTGSKPGVGEAECWITTQGERLWRFTPRF